MHSHGKNILLIAVILPALAFAADLPPGGSPQDTGFAAYEGFIQQLMSENSIEGASFALFDDRNVIWSGGLGRMGGENDQPVTTQTIFSIQSMSKTITATAVMIAVQEGLVDLDRPVTEYLPGFRVNSCFENDPEKKITLRLMLGCAAGFTHEAPVGNNYDASFPSYSEHFRSIRDTWLRSPVGTEYFYSNLGFDLAAEIIEKVSGRTFAKYLEEKVFRPLGMVSATADPKKILESRMRAAGSASHYARIPVIVPMIGAGGVYASADDLVKFVQMHLSSGSPGGRRVLDKEYLAELYRPFITGSYALGIALVDDTAGYAFNHNGGGFGFGSTMKWYPEYNIGCVILSNRLYESRVYETASRILDEYIREQHLTKDTLTLFDPVAYWKHLTEAKKTTEHPATAPGRCPGDSVYKSEWGKYTGTHLLGFSGGFEFAWYAKIARWVGFKAPKVKVFEKDGGLFLDYHDGGSYLGEQRLVEYQPGLFFTAEGEALDFRDGRKTYRNIALE